MVGEGERRVVQQSIMPGHTHCTDIFIESWELLLNAKWNQVSHPILKSSEYNELESFLVFIHSFKRLF